MGEVHRKDAILIGGQALGIWADLLLDPEMLDELGGPVTSKDMDFYGTIELAHDVARALGGWVSIPSLDNVNAPEAAVVYCERDGRIVQIDILGRMSGLSSAEINNGWLELPYQVGSGEVIIRVMAPMEILRSRISNVIDLRRTYPSAIRQLKVAPHVVEAHILSALNRITVCDQDDEKELITGLQKSAQDEIKELIRCGRSPRLDRIFLDYEVDLLQHALALANHSAWDPRFAENQIVNAANEGITRRTSRILERERKFPGFLSATSS